MKWLPFASFLVISAATLVADEQPKWTFIENGDVRLGVDPRSGGAIGYFGPSGGPNLLNHHDRGRFVQQSYYGRPDGTRWAEKDWRWNPVQGGDYRGGRAKLLDLASDKTTLTAKSLARHWSGCVDLPDVVFSEKITLDGPIAHVRFSMTYSGDQTHPATHQDIPAVFIEPEYDTFVLYDGDQPWTDAPVSRSKPGWPNESRTMSENWAAYVNDDGFGLGVYVPAATQLTCYRFAAGKTSDEGACSYFAPLTTFAITPDKTFEYDVYLTCGNVSEMRQRFRQLRVRAKTDASRDSKKGKPE